MSGFDEENPFADPSVQNAFSASQNQQQNLDDYNPFANQQAQTGVAGNGPFPAGSQLGGPQGAPVLNTQNIDQGAPPPSYTATNQQQISSKDFEELKRRQEELEKRAQELERREAELRNNPQNVRTNNWPPVPSICPFQSCFYQDINVEIPVEFQKMVRNLYYIWIAHASLYTSNVLIGMLYLFAGGKDSGATFGLALVYWFLFTPASYMCWFRPVYKAFRDDSSMYFMVFFFTFFFQFLLTILYSLGIGGMGSSGLITGFTEVSAGGGFAIFVGILQIVNGVGFGIAALADFYLLVTIHKMYRSTGASMAKAQAEFTTGVMKNESVRQAASEAASASVRSQFQAATGTGNNQESGGGSNRF